MRTDVGRRHRPLTICLLLALGAVLAACSLGGEARYPGERKKGQAPQYGPPPSIFGEEGISFGNTDQPDDGAGGGIGVNSFLWRASLDTVSFMPLVSADPFGGVIITDWYSPPETPSERFKVNVYILGRSLRADGVRAAVFRQELDSAVGWVDAAVADGTETDLEDAILTRARQMRVLLLGE